MLPGVPAPVTTYALFRDGKFVTQGIQSDKMFPALEEKRADIIGRFGCKGYDTFGPFRLIGGIAKGHPNEKDMDDAVQFVKGLQE